jgi:hypothetical protein
MINSATVPGFSARMGAYSAGIVKQSMGARNQVGLVLSCRPGRPHRLAELIPWNRLLGSLKVKKFWLWYLSSGRWAAGMTESELSKLILKQREKKALLARQYA